ncbi:MAG: hypothetical protein LH615_16570 [Ferruginibacter sp.]|nr:hypothetical protein [Ferruginibacter sp.]
MKNIWLLLTLLFCKTIAAQTPESLLQKVQENYSAEKIYIHYDKSNYVAGETIWFKAYLMDGILPSTKSTVLCVELINDSGITVQKKILSINGSTAVGEFELPKTMLQGSYVVKAFTRHLMNFGFEKYYYQSIEIYNPTSTIQPVKEENSTSVYFLPEGGNLIGNVKSIIAFKCTDMRGYPVSAEGKIVDASGKVQTSFKTSYDGMGSFEFSPKPFEQYFAECVLNHSENRRVQLPASTKEGIGLKIYHEKGKAKFSIDATTINNELFLPNYILGVQENMVVFKSIIQAGSNIINGEIPIQQLPTGILQITVFNKENKPLAERLVFVNSGDYIPEGNFAAPVVNLSSRAKNVFSYTFNDTIPGSFSVAVTAFDEQNKKVDDIVSRFLLTNDIKGYVHNPSYYFEKNDMEHQQNLDLVMLTNGWRKYSWIEILSNKFPSMGFKDPDFITAKGKAYDAVSGKPLINDEISIIIKTKDKKGDFLLRKTDNEGNIFMGGMNYEDTASFTFQSNTTKNRRVNTFFNTPSLSSIFYSVKTAVPKRYFELPNEQLKLKILNEYNFNKITKDNGILLDEVKVLAKIKSEKEKFEKQYVSGRMGGIASKEIDLITNPTTSSLNIFDYLRSSVSGLNITGGPFDYSINYRSTRTLSGGNIPMNIFLDEFQVEPNQIATLRVQEVAMVKLFSMGGLSGAAGGSLVIYTKRGGGSFSNNIIEHKIQLMEGFTPTKEFFSPNYDVTDEIKTDERTTLYWNPYLITSPEKKSINFSFFNSDKAKKIKVIIEGFLEDGKLLHVEKIIE